MYSKRHIKQYYSQNNDSKEPEIKSAVEKVKVVFSRALGCRRVQEERTYNSGSLKGLDKLVSLSRRTYFKTHKTATLESACETRNTHSKD